MWDFPQYISEEQAFNFSCGALKAIGAGAVAKVGAGTAVEAGAEVAAESEAGAAAKVGAQASKTALKILYKSSLEYLGILIVVIGASATGSFVPESPVDWSDNLSPDLGGGEEPGGKIEGVSEGAT